MEIKLDSTYKGTRILFGNKAKNKRSVLNQMISILESYEGGIGFAICVDRLLMCK